MQQFPVVLTVAGAAGNHEDVVGDNVSVINQMFRSGLTAGSMAPNALRSYFVDFYLTQALDGGFAQYVFMSPEREVLDRQIREGLFAMGAAAHLELFNRCTGLYDLLTETELLDYAEDGGDLAAHRADGAVAMNVLDAEFEDLFEREDVTGLNAAWIKAQPGLLVLTEAELVDHIADRVAWLEGAQAEAKL